MLLGGIAARAAAKTSTGGRLLAGGCLELVLPESRDLSSRPRDEIKVPFAALFWPIS